MPKYGRLGYWIIQQKNKIRRARLAKQFQTGRFGVQGKIVTLTLG